MNFRVPRLLGNQGKAGKRVSLFLVKKNIREFEKNALNKGKIR